MSVSPLRILTMTDVLPDPDKGASGAEVQTVDALRAQGHHVDAIWSDTLGRRIRHGNLHLLIELPRTYARGVAEMMRRASYDVAHVSQPHGFRAARVVHEIAPGCAFIHRSHGFELHVEEALRPWRARFPDSRRGFRRLASAGMQGLVARHSYAIAREADGHIVSSSLDAAFLKERIGVPTEKIAVIPQAAPAEYQRVPPMAMTRERARRVLHVAQFAFFKAPMVTASTMRLLAAACPDVEFTWVCDRAHHEAVRALLDSGTNRRTELLHWMPQEELRRVYDRCGIFLFPSFFEGFGRAFLEAMSRGLCVLASDCGGMHDVIDGRNGVLVPVGDAEALAHAGRRLIEDTQGAAAMSTAAASSAREYSWDRVARETVAFYRRRLAAIRSERP